MKFHDLPCGCMEKPGPWICPLPPGCGILRHNDEVNVSHDRVPLSSSSFTISLALTYIRGRSGGNRVTEAKPTRKKTGLRKPGFLVGRGITFAVGSHSLGPRSRPGPGCHAAKRNGLALPQCGADRDSSVRFQAYCPQTRRRFQYPRPQVAR
jgi:hypothetical protein